LRKKGGRSDAIRLREFWAGSHRTLTGQYGNSRRWNAPWFVVFWPQKLREENFQCLTYFQRIRANSSLRPVFSSTSNEEQSGTEQQEVSVMDDEFCISAVGIAPDMQHSVGGVVQ